jgi:hypothetical protein
MRPAKILMVGSSVSILLFLLIFILFLTSIINFIDFYSIIIAAFISSINFALGGFFIKFSIKKDHKTFLTTILAGMVGRLFLTILLVFLSLKFLEINQNSFIFSIFFFYVYYLLLEIFYLNFREK